MDSDIKNIKNIIMNTSTTDKGVDLSQLALEIKDNLFINNDSDENFENIKNNKKLKSINLSEKFRIYVDKAYYKNEIITHIDNVEKVISFYVLSNNYNYFKKHLLNIYRLYTSKKYVNYILECERKIDIEKLLGSHMSEKLYEY